MCCVSLFLPLKTHFGVAVHKSQNVNDITQKNVFSPLLPPVAVNYAVFVENEEKWKKVNCMNDERERENRRPYAVDYIVNAELNERTREWTHKRNSCWTFVIENLTCVPIGVSMPRRSWRTQRRHNVCVECSITIIDTTYLIFCAMPKILVHWKRGQNRLKTS